MQLDSNNPFEWISFKGRKAKYFVVKLGRPRFNEIDNYGVVWNGHYVNYFETARHLLCRYCDFDMEILSKAGVFLPVHSLEMTLKKPVLPNDEMSVAVRITKFEGSQFEFSHLLLVNGETRASCKVEHIPVLKETGAIAYKIPDEVVRMMRPLSELFADDR